MYHHQQPPSSSQYQQPKPAIQYMGGATGGGTGAYGGNTGGTGAYGGHGMPMRPSPAAPSAPSAPADQKVQVTLAGREFIVYLDYGQVQESQQILTVLRDYQSLLEPLVLEQNFHKIPSPKPAWMLNGTPVLYECRTKNVFNKVAAIDRLRQFASDLAQYHYQQQQPQQQPHQQQPPQQPPQHPIHPPIAPPTLTYPPQERHHPPSSSAAFPGPPPRGNFSSSSSSSSSSQGQWVSLASTDPSKPMNPREAFPKDQKIMVDPRDGILDQKLRGNEEPHRQDAYDNPLTWYDPSVPALAGSGVASSDGSIPMASGSAASSRGPLATSSSEPMPGSGPGGSSRRQTSDPKLTEEQIQAFMSRRSQSVRPQGASGAAGFAGPPRSLVR